MRMVLLVRGLRERLTNLRESLEWTAAGTVPIDEAIKRAQRSLRHSAMAIEAKRSSPRKRRGCANCSLRSGGWSEVCEI